MHVDNSTVLPLVLYGTTGIYVISGLLSMLTRPNNYDQVGQGGLLGSDEDCTAENTARARLDQLAADHAERVEDARQMLQARNDRRLRQGLEPLDIEAELERLNFDATAPAKPADVELVEEIRQLVILRNERRLRQQLDALDVEAEIERTLAELAIPGTDRFSSAR